ADFRLDLLPADQPVGEDVDLLLEVVTSERRGGLVLLAGLDLGQLRVQGGDAVGRVDGLEAVGHAVAPWVAVAATHWPRPRLVASASSASSPSRFCTCWVLTGLPVAVLTPCSA